MSTSFTIRHTFDVDVDTYWEKIFFNTDFNVRLYREELGFDAYDVLEEKDEGGGVITRKVRTMPKADAPKAIKKLLGDALSYLEEGRFDPERRRWVYTITPSRMADKVTINGEYWVEPRGDKKVERICTVDLEARIFGVGKVLESFIEKSTRDSYEKAAAGTRRYIAAEGL